MLKATFLMLAALGLAMSAFGVHFIVHSSAARSWPSVDGQIVNVAIRTYSSINDRRSQSGRERSYFPQVTYQWMVGDRSFDGKRYSLGQEHPGYAERSEARDAAKRFPVGGDVKVYYDPADPASAVLDRSLQPGVFVPLPLGLLMLAVGVAGWLGLRRQQAGSTRSDATADQ